MTSKYDGSRWENGQQVGTADRSFKFYYATHHHYRLDNCVWTDYSTYDEEILLPDALTSLNWGKIVSVFLITIASIQYVLFRFFIGSEKVISSIKSEHDNGYEDRKWAFEYCDLIPKCGVFESLELYDPIETGEADTELKAKVINNLEMSYPLTTSVEITEVDTTR